MKYYYKAISKEGKTLDGFVKARSSKEAASFLQKQEMFPVKITEHKTASSYFGVASSKKISAKNRVFFTRQLSIMLNSGLTLMQALNILKDQAENKALKAIVEGLINDIEAGSSLSDAVQKYPKAFSSIYVALIKAAESSGLLDKVLDRLALTLEKQKALRDKVRSAMIYPAIVILLMFGVGVLMMVMVVPQISGLYESFDVDLPPPTRILIGMSDLTTTFWPVLLIGGLGGGFFIIRWRKTVTGRNTIDKLVLKTPIFGKIVSENILTEFSRTLGLLVGAGSGIVPSLKILGDVSGNVKYENAINQVAVRVEKGVSVGDALNADSLFPSYLVQMVKIGEQSGKLDDSLTRASAYYEDEVERLVKALTTAMEPFIIVVLGLGVGFLLISVISPIYELTSAF